MEYYFQDNPLSGKINQACGIKQVPKQLTI